MHPDAAAHEIRREHVVLEDPVADEEDRDPQQVVVSRDSRDEERKHRGGERTQHGNDLQHRGDRGEQHAVRHLEQGEKQAVRDQGGEAEEADRAHVLSKRTVKLRKDAEHPAARRPRPQLLRQGLLDPGAVFNQNEGEDRNQGHEDQVAGEVHSMRGDILGNRNRRLRGIADPFLQHAQDAGTVGLEPRRQTGVCRERGGLGERGQLLGELARFVGSRRSHERESQDGERHDEEERLRDRDRAREPAPVDALDQPHQGRDQIGEEEREHEDQERLAHHVDDIEREDDQPDGPGRSCRARIESQHSGA